MPVAVQVLDPAAVGSVALARVRPAVVVLAARLAFLLRDPEGQPQAAATGADFLANPAPAR
ncbi:MAG TPA: hypothetical protein VMB02_12150 [Candidatus Aquilonibacter sp.]|nr:hypothetical protein [Candidatus Aquilonibacter sp.]